MALPVALPGNLPCKVVKWKVKKGYMVSQATILCLYKAIDSNDVQKLKCNHSGTVKELLFSEGQTVEPGDVLVQLEGCKHPTVMKDMCADCGADLRQEREQSQGPKKAKSATVAMVHSIPELIVSEEQALEIGRKDEQRLLNNRKLVLLVDLDQTLLHTTNDNIPANLKDVEHFRLWHGRWTWYHTKFRPATRKFLDEMSKLYELHICTFGVRMYAHTIAGILDPEGKYFSHRILSRDECFSANSKTANLKALFPCGDSMVCIIDDRDDVWKFANNLVHVKPYLFFDGTADINAPPGAKKTQDAANHAPRHNVRVLRVPRNRKLEQDMAQQDSEHTTATEGETGTEDDKDSALKELPGDSEGKETKSVQNEDKDNEAEASNVQDKSQNVLGEMDNPGCIEEAMDVGEVSQNKPSSAAQTTNKPADGDTQSAQPTPQEDSVESPKQEEGVSNTNTSPVPEEESSSQTGTDETSLKVDDSPKHTESTSNTAEEEIETIKKTAAEPDSTCLDDLELSDSEAENSEKEDPSDVPTSKPDESQALNDKEDEAEKETPVNGSGNRSEKEEGEVTSDDDKCDSQGVGSTSQTQDTVPESGKVQVGSEQNSESAANGATSQGSENQSQSIQGMADPAQGPPNPAQGPAVDYEEVIEWEDTDDYLIYLEDILRRIHAAYYEIHDSETSKSSGKIPDLKTIIPYIKKKVLKGVNILFSGVIPTNQPPDKSRAYQAARSLGANVHVTLVSKEDAGEGEEPTTHVVAAKRGTVKVHQAKQLPGMRIVNPDWLWACLERWEWVDERIFPLPDGGSPAADSPEPWRPKRRPGKDRRGTPTRKDGTGTPSKTSETAKPRKERKFSDSYNPLYAFSPSAIKEMDAEVEEIFDESESEDEEAELRRVVLGFGKKRPREDSSSEESLCPEYPRGWKKKRSPRACEPGNGSEDEEDENEERRRIVENPGRVMKFTDDDDTRDGIDAESIGSVDDEMAAALEREFLSY